MEIKFKLNKSTVNGESGNPAEGYTVVVDGQLKELFDRMSAIDPKNYPDYGNIIARCLTRGIIAAVGEMNKK